MDSRADTHDRDKLERWRREISAALDSVASPSSGSGFPVYAVFLVSEEDRAAHDIFRRFRTSFESRGAGFQHLVIFGQHGVSSTVRGLLDKLGLPVAATPCLALFAGPAAVLACTLHLPAGGGCIGCHGGNDATWRQVLAQVEAAADQGMGFPGLASLPGTTARRINGETIIHLLGGLPGEP